MPSDLCIQGEQNASVAVFIDNRCGRSVGLSMVASDSKKHFEKKSYTPLFAV